MTSESQKIQGSRVLPAAVQKLEDDLNEAIERVCPSLPRVKLRCEAINASILAPDVVPDGWSIVEPASFTPWAIFCKDQGGSVWPSVRHVGMFYANQGNGECAYFESVAEAVSFVERADWKRR